jgi:hypothetical protein
MEIAEIIEAFGVDPDETGNRPRGWWIIEAQEQIEDEEESAGCQVGDLVVKTRDGGSNPIDPEAFKKGNCIGTSEDGFDCTYRYYYYRKLES